MASTDSDFVTAVNFMLEDCRSVHRIDSLEEFSSAAVIVELCEKILGQTLQGILRNTSGSSDEAWNIQVVIDTLAADILHVDLSHITGENVVAKDTASLKNLIEILSGLMEIVLEATAAGSDAGSPDDSNILSSDAMSVVSSVLQQELGHSYKPEMMRSLKLTGKGRHFASDVSSETASPSSITEVPRVGTVRVSHEVVAVGEIASSTSSLSSSEQVTPRSVKMPSVSSITSDLSEKQTPLVRRNSLGAQPVSSTPRKASQRPVIQKNKERFSRARGELADKSSGRSRDEEDTAQLVNEALEALSQHTISSSDESTASLIRLRPQQNETRRPAAAVTQPVCVPAVHKDTLIQGQQLKSLDPIESQPVRDYAQQQPQLQTVSHIQQQERETQGIAIQTDDVDPGPIHSQLTKRDVGTQEPITDGSPLHPVVSESSGSSISSQPSSVKESCNESEHEGLISHPPDTAVLTKKGVATASSGSKREHQEEICQPDVQVVGPEPLESHLTKTSQSDILTIQTDDIPVDLSKQSQVNIKPFMPQSDAHSHITTDSPVRLRHLEVAAESSEAARQVGDVSEARRQVFLEDALQKDRAAVLKTVYERLLADSEQGWPEIDIPRPRAKSRSRKKQVAFRTLATTIKPTRPSPTVSRKKSDHGVRSSGSPYAQPVVGMHVRQPRHRGVSQSKSSYRPLSDQPKVHVRDNELLPILVDEFPFLHVSAATVQQMWRKQMNQIRGITRAELNRQRHPKAAVQLEEAEHRQQALLEVMKKDMKHTQRMREQQERDHQLRYVKTRLQEKRQSSARAKQYYDEYVIGMRARQMKRRTKEEQIFKKLFEDGIEIQKARLQELRQYAKDKRDEQAKRQHDEVESLENYYRDQFALLAENIGEEKRQMQIRDEAQAKVVHKMRRELRNRMEKEIKDLQKAMVQDEDVTYFRQLDADRLRQRLQVAYYHMKL